MYNLNRLFYIIVQSGGENIQETGRKNGWLADFDYHFILIRQVNSSWAAK